MRIGRIILTIWVALSLAVLPVASGFAVAKDQATADEPIASEEVAVASAHDCCDHDGMPADHAMKDCRASAGCAAKCFNLYAVVFSAVAIPSPIGGMESAFVSLPFHGQTASPPYRPPRL